MVFEQGQHKDIAMRVLKWYSENTLECFQKGDMNPLPTRSSFFDKCESEFQQMVIKDVLPNVVPMCYPLPASPPSASSVEGQRFSMQIVQSALTQDEAAQKQTIAKLQKDLEDLILGAEDKLYALEFELFSDIRDQVGAEVVRIQRTAKAVAALDVFASLALVAQRNNFVRPKINETGLIDIRNGRHPVVEQMIENDMFIPNDTYLDNHKKRISIITGPNMAGKSTYMRQTA